MTTSINGYVEYGYGIWDSDADRSTYGYFSIPLNVAMQVKLNETWALNAGASADIVAFNNYAEKYNMAETGPEKIVDIYESSEFYLEPGMEYSLGFTGKIGDLTLDTYLNTDILTDGPYFISGSDSL